MFNIVTCGNFSEPSYSFMEQNSAEIIILLSYLIYYSRICSRRNWMCPHLLFLLVNSGFFWPLDWSSSENCLMERTSQKQFFPQKGMSKEK